MPRPKITLFFDLHSPYSYLAFYVLNKSPIFRQCDITYIPVLLVAFIKLVGLNPPWSSPNKVNYLWTDMARWRAEYNIPWKQGFPENYPFKVTTLKVQRILTACMLESPLRQADLVAALYHAFWVEKKGVQLPEVHEPIVIKILGQNVGTRIIERSTSEEVKALLKQNTEDAVASGAPGLPWVKAVNATGREECFFGFDHIGQVTRFLGLEKLNGPHL
ncbi:thioredoxin-like protein [Exophiala viscosa]|uniref:Glutathione S-transferase kappa n=1 Tax=Exophiala viscosa TaxID=2486360 RepID=A0AAN6II92_9EURO|nr:thioredoxin-like protein [Exophiala viscosa]